MRIKKMRVENFRSIRRETLEFDGLTALVGANGAGKSAFLLALLVFQGRQEPDIEDFYNRDTSRDIRIAVTFTGLPGAAAKEFARYLRGGDLEAVRVCRYNKSKGTVESSLHGACPRNPDFDAVRGASGPVAALDEYDRLRGRPEYASLPGRAAGAAARAALDGWESDNPGRCGRAPDDGRFFGFDEGAAGNLGRFVKILYAPALRRGRGPGPRELLDMAVESAMAGGGGARHRELQQGVDADYTTVRAPGGLSGAARLEDGINEVLGALDRAARADLGRGPREPLAGLFAATARLDKDGYTAALDRAGDGLRRLFSLAMACHMHGTQIGRAAPGSGRNAGVPSVVLAIEEPELHQHPSQARHIAGLLSSISVSGFAGVANDVQVAYTTHSPHFVGVDRMGQIRLVRKEGGEEGMPKVTRVWITSVDKIQERLAGAGASKHADPEKLRRNFDRILAPLMSEGFFARTAVLVEGDSDRVAIMRAAEMLGMPLDEKGAAVIPCGSKFALPGSYAMFKNLGKRVYLVWDGYNDNPREKNRNRRLLSILGIAGDKIDGGAPSESPWHLAYPGRMPAPLGAVGWGATWHARRARSPGRLRAATLGIAPAAPPAGRRRRGELDPRGGEKHPHAVIGPGPRRVPVKASAARTWGPLHSGRARKTAANRMPRARARGRAGRPASKDGMRQARRGGRGNFARGGAGGPPARRGGGAG